MHHDHANRYTPHATPTRRVHSMHHDHATQYSPSAISICRVHSMHHRLIHVTSPLRQMSRVLSHGFTLVELVIALLIGAILIAALHGVVGQTLTIEEAVTEREQLTQQARFAMERMVRTVSHSRLLLLPLVDKPFSDWREHVREETVPASPPEGSSTKATAVLAVTLPLYVDLDGDGYPDADDDQDGLIDEDLPEDIHNDFAPGIYLIDDGGNGATDEGIKEDDDETNSIEGEDPINGVDDDDDGNIDEDPSANMNEDGCPGLCGVDDDADGNLDESGVNDDDEDGQEDEDWYNTVVFYLDNGTLMERMPVPWNEDGISNPHGPVDGRDFVASAIADNVTRFRVERIPRNGDRAQRVDLILELTSPATDEAVSLHTQVRVGGAL